MKIQNIIVEISIDNTSLKPELRTPVPAFSFDSMHRRHTGDVWNYNAHPINKICQEFGAFAGQSVDCVEIDSFAIIVAFELALTPDIYNEIKAKSEQIENALCIP